MMEDNRKTWLGLKGSPDDLVRRPEGCIKKYCILEKLLAPEMRKIKVIEKEIPANHAHREIIEQACGKHFDDRCHLKYLLMRTGVEDYMVAQMGAVEYYAEKEDIEFDDALDIWGHGEYAVRWQELWNLTKREIIEDDEIVDYQQTMTVRGLAEKVTAESKHYRRTVKNETKYRRKFIRDNNLGEYLKK